MRRRVDLDVINASTLVADKDARRAVRAFRAQLRDHFAPVWEASADVAFVPRGERPRRGAWQLVLVDSRDASYGYHELTREGLPLGKVFLREAMKTRSGWTVTASHEILELLVDPDTTFGVVVEDRSLGPRFYSYEVCDPVQDDRFAYDLGGTPVSDFVYPAWFEPWRRSTGRAEARFDHARKLRMPFEVPTDCYAMFFDVRKRKWLQNWGGHVVPRLGVPGGMPDRGGSRAALHGSPRLEWRKSTR